MPSRASFMTGRYPHQTGHWCNVTPYDGHEPTWAHGLRGNGVPVHAIGKLHFRGADVDAGFDTQTHAMYAVNGTGDLFGAIRQTAPLPVRHGVREVAEKVGRGESDYTRYDRAIAEAAVHWLTHVAPGLPQPWVLYVGFVAPHFPLIAPDAFYDLYDPETLPLPKACRPEEWPDHPWIEGFRHAYITDSFFDDDLRRRAIAAYYGLCSFVDHNLGRVMDAVQDAGLGGATRLIYASDHGDNLGARGLWQKSNFYQESAHVPLVLAGPGVPQGRVVNTAVSLIDLYPTMFDATDTPPPDDGRTRDGHSLLAMANAPDDPTREVFGEYHAAGAISGAFMLRRGDWKYIHYAGLPPQLFNLGTDPEELDDRAADPACADVLAGFETRLRARLNPEAVDARAKADQLAILNRHGGASAVLAKGSMGASPPPGTRFQGNRTA
jgi:choline-sulfatase